MRETRTVITTKCDRPRCGRLISELEHDPAVSEERTPDLVIKRAGKPDIVYDDLCDICTKAVDNYILGIEKKPKKKESAEPSALGDDDDGVLEDNGSDEAGHDPEQDAAAE